MEKPQTSAPAGGIWRMLKEQRRFLLTYPWFLFQAAVSTAAELGGMEGFRRVLNAVPAKDTALLRNGLILMLVSLLISGLFELLHSMTIGRVELGMRRNICLRMISRLMKSRLESSETYHSGDLVDRVIGSTEVVTDGICWSLKDAIGSILSKVAVVLYLCTINVPLALCTAAFIVASPFIGAQFAKPVNKLHTRLATVHAEKSALIQDAVQGAEVVRVYTLAERIGRKFDGFLLEMVQITQKLIPADSLQDWMPDIIQLVGNAFIFGVGALMVAQGQMLVGDVVAFFWLFGMIYNSMWYIAGLWPSLQKTRVACKRVFEITDLPVEDESGKTTAVPTHGDIRFEHVSFAYKEGEAVLKDASFTLREGKCTAIVGPSGGGKTTMVKLLLGLYRPREGRVLIGDADLHEIQFDAWRERVAWVSQESTIFSGTARENLQFGRMDAPEEELVRAARAARIHDTLTEREGGYDAAVAERGDNFSGGERQRLAIARAMLSNPQLLVLDEPTSALDQENERHVMQALEALMPGRTSVVIAHRLSTTRNADHILYVENGAVAEEGTHDELMARQGLYCAMYNNAEEALLS